MNSKEIFSNKFIELEKYIEYNILEEKNIQSQLLCKKSMKYVEIGQM